MVLSVVDDLSHFPLRVQAPDNVNIHPLDSQAHHNFQVITLLLSFPQKRKHRDDAPCVTDIC